MLWSAGLLLLVVAYFGFLASRAGSVVDVVYPEDGHITEASNIFVYGSTDPRAHIVVNGQRAMIHENGAFLALTPLWPGPNRVVTAAIGPRGTAIDHRTVVRLPPLASMPDIPTAIRSESISPAMDLVLLGGDALSVSFQGSPGGKATFAVGRSDAISMHELDPSRTGGLRGIYVGEYRLGHISFSAQAITCTVLGTDGQTLSATAPGKVTVWKADPPVVAETLDGAVLRESPEGQHLMQLPSGVKLHVVGRVGEYSKIRVAPTMEAWVLSRSIRSTQAGTPAEGDALKVSAHRSKDATQVRVALTTRLPYYVTQQIEPGMLILTIYGVRSRPKAVERDPEETLLSSMEAVLDGPVFQLKLDLNLRQQWGYRTFYEGKTLVLQIRHPPLVDWGSPFKRRIIAIDPGHGGTDSVTIGPTRLREKDVNLILTLRLRDLLVRAGATVVMTRTEDRTLDLHERVAIAQQQGAEVLVSIHSNSLADGADPRIRHGTSTYYYHPQSRTLAEAIHRALLEHLGLRDDGLRKKSFTLTLPTYMPSVLVEIAYMIYPPEEDLLRRPQFQERVALGIMKGIETFLKQSQ